MIPRPTTPLLAALLLAGLAAGCTGEPAPAPSPTATAGGAAPVVVDPDLETLAGMVAELRATVTALRTELEAAAVGDQEALRTAADLLVADVATVTSGGNGEDGEEADAPADDTDTADDDDTGTAEDAGDDTSDADAAPPAVDLDGPAPILPGPRSSREESFQYGDLLTRTLAAARSAGTEGEPVLRFLGDPLAGDLGSWQRAPDDQLAAIAEAGATTDLDAAGTAVLALQGEAPRALAWVVHGLAVPADAEEAAGRALAHLTVIELALDQLA